MPGTVLFQAASIGYTAIAKPVGTNQGFPAIKPFRWYFRDYVYYYLKVSKNIAEELVSGTTFKEISKVICCPAFFLSSPEQHRIVAKIEELFASLDKHRSPQDPVQQQFIKLTGVV